jgi:hypothetical protein
MLGVDDDSGMASGKDPKHFVGKSLSHGSYVTKVHYDLADVLQICKEASCLRPGDEIRPQQPDAD